MNGFRDSLNFTLPDGFNMIGGKGIGVYGGLDLHGKPRNVTWTTLAATAQAGTNIITLESPVDWQVDEEIVLTTTTYRHDQTETVRIASISSDRKTLTLKSNLQFDHLFIQKNYSNGYKSFKIAAAVGLLTRNVRIIGSEYNGQDGDLYGSRVIVSDYSFMKNVNGEVITTYYKGFIRATDVEFYRFGQYSK